MKFGKFEIDLGFTFVIAFAVIVCVLAIFEYKEYELKEMEQIKQIELQTKQTELQIEQLKFTQSTTQNTAQEEN